MKELNERQEAILRRLEQGPADAWALENTLYFGIGGYNATPLASIRRAIQSLRRRGYNISFADPVTGVYTLGNPTKFDGVTTGGAPDIAGPGDIS